MSVLAEIFEHKADEVAAARRKVSEQDLRQQARDASPCRGFREALRGAPVPVSLIAEIKRASPSKGIIREAFDPEAIAREYEEAGAQTLSVLTDERYFQGSSDYLRIARETTRLPCLRKDFLNTEYQIYQSRAWDADAVLLIAAALERNQLADLHELATSLGMDVLVEVHNESETRMALEIGAPLIGANNRNLADFSVSLAITEALMPLIGKNAVGVSESAIGTAEDVERVHATGARAVLVGTTFCAAPDIGRKVKEVMGW
jgi:indole-3-glycerol phosphate synthase